MRKLMIFISALILISVPALADIDQVVEEYNLHTVTTSAEKLAGVPEIEEKDGKVAYTYSVGENIAVKITLVNGEARVFTCLCFDESAAAEFLAQCANSCCQIGGYSSLFYCYEDILDLFLQSRAGNETETRKLESEGLVYNLTKHSYGYAFIIAR